MADKKDNPKHCKLLSQTGLNGKSITDVHSWQEGSVCILEINYTGGPYYFKVKGMQIECGGTSDWGSGSLVNF